MMADKGALTAIDNSDRRTGDLLEPAFQHPVDNAGEVRAGLSLVDQTRAALVYAAAAASAREYMAAAHAPSTLRAYASCWCDWTLWAEAHAVPALPANPVDVGAYLAYKARGVSPASLRLRLAAIAAAHRAAGLADTSKDPTVKAVLRGIQRTRRVEARRKTPLVVAAMRAVLAGLADDARGERDRALLLIGWGAALRRSELVALDWRDVEVADEGLVVHIRRSKIDQLGRGQAVGIPHHENAAYDAVRAYLAWQSRVGPETLAVFRPVTRTGWVLERRLQPREVARIVKRVADRAGLVGDYSGHSLRAGFATAAAAAGASERSIMAQTRHQSLTVMRSYIRPASLWLENAAAIAAL
jgi:integrase